MWNRRQGLQNEPFAVSETCRRRREWLLLLEVLRLARWGDSFLLGRTRLGRHRAASAWRAHFLQCCIISVILVVQKLQGIIIFHRLQLLLQALPCNLSSRWVESQWRPWRRLPECWRVRWPSSAQKVGSRLVEWFTLIHKMVKALVSNKKWNIHGECASHFSKAYQVGKRCRSQSPTNFLSYELDADTVPTLD